MFKFGLLVSLLALTQVNYLDIFEAAKLMFRFSGRFPTKSRCVETQTSFRGKD